MHFENLDWFDQHVLLLQAIEALDVASNAVYIIRKYLDDPMHEKSLAVDCALIEMHTKAQVLNEIFDKLYKKGR